MARNSPIKGIRNFRSLSSIGTYQGKRIVDKRFYRCASLHHAPKESIQALRDDYDVRLIIDLRTDEEASRNPDPKIEGVRHLIMPLMQEQNNGIVRATDTKSWFERVRQYRELEETYAFLGGSPYCLKQLGIVLNECMNLKEGAVLWHCSAGKDRTGIVAFLILNLLGYPMDKIYKDYLRSNKGSRSFALKRSFQCFNATHDLALSRKVKRSSIANKKYLNAFIKALVNTIGSLDNFYKDYCHFTQEDIQAYKEAYLK